MPLIFVKKHAIGSAPKVTAVHVGLRNSVEELMFGLQLEDASWFAIDERWIVLDEKTKIEELPKLLYGDGLTAETPFECKMRVGGIFIDAFNAVVWGISTAMSWVYPGSSQGKTKEPQPEPHA